MANDPINLLDPSGLAWYEYFDWVDPVGNFFMGAADTVTMGATGWIRDKAGLSDQVNPCSGAYRYGGHAATVAEFAFGVGAAALAKGLGRFAARRMAKRLCRTSFAGGTLIETKQGYKPIEDIAVGDEVWSRDDRTGAEGWARVVRVFARHKAEVLEVVLLEADGDAQKLVVTPEHPLMTRNGWTAVGRLELGERVSAGDDWAEVVSMVSSKERQTVYNFEVEGTHNYFVESGGVWAHNGCAAGSDILVTKAVNSKLPHAIDQGVARGVFSNANEAGSALRELTKQISNTGAFPKGTLVDTARANSFLVPVGNNGLAVYRLGRNGTAILKTVLVAK
ncbi:MAG: Hint domain-containing protein [Proteobacteria bacterium]|nr:Hint domain-containing protein [Pseudomonadota bacterium]